MRSALKKATEEVNAVRVRPQRVASTAVRQRDIGASLLSLQRTHGNSFVQRLLAKTMVQPKCGCEQSPGKKGGCQECAQFNSLSRARLQDPTEVSLTGPSLPSSVAAYTAAGALNHEGSQPDGPNKGITEDLSSDEEKPSPKNGSATIQCDGKAGYEIVYNGWESAACGTKDCVTKHESSHIADWKAKWPTGCNKQPKGYLPKGDPPDDPVLTVDEYKAFLKKSECTAHTVDLACANALPKPKDCEKTVNAYITLTENQRKSWC